ncbi:calmodulin-binding protein 60 B [Pyrus x bretschneideri]|uniref:calmodulin-binding protein 60 B n=1 Tax=Pyrus x bretschneideri TaxID=225117 RepID=UPI00203007C9|nr:calmodulin-binding protein 60 B [Pyrus x bretschneideri]
MVPKRHFRDRGSEDFEFPVPESKRRPTFRNVVRDVMRDATLNEREWESFLRRIVREEVERGILPFLMSSPSVSRPSLESGSTSGGSGLQLRFVNKLAGTIFTGGRVEAENGEPLQIELVDASTGAIVRSGPLSLLKLELLVVNGEFGSDDQEDWTEREFNNYIVRARDGKRPLVTGEIHVTLREGVGSVGDVMFTDNSSWIRSRKFRLAARAVAKSSSEVRIREARSEPFVVKDHRGELYKKHYPPNLNDEIWRLEKIAKDGAFHKRLCENGISTVEEFLQLYMRDVSSLRNAFGGISNKIWETIIEHAMTCKLDDHKCYAYRRAEHDVSLMFNSIHRLEGAIINGQFCSLDELDAHQKMLVETLKQHAYQNVRDLIPVDSSTIFGLSRPLPCPQAEQFTSPNPDLQQIQFQFTHQDELPIQLGFNHGSASTSCAYQAEGSSNQLMVSLAQSQPMQLRSNSFSMEDFNSVIYNEESSWPSLGVFQAPNLPTGHLGTENLFQVQASTWSPANPIWGQTGGFYFTSGSEAEAAHFPLPAFVHNAGTRRKPKACWCKLRAAIKWWVSVRKHVSARRMARPPMYLNY